MQGKVAINDFHVYQLRYPYLRSWAPSLLHHETWHWLSWPSRIGFKSSFPYNEIQRLSAAFSAFQWTEGIECKEAVVAPYEMTISISSPQLLRQFFLHKHISSRNGAHFCSWNPATLVTGCDQSNTTGVVVMFPGSWAPLRTGNFLFLAPIEQWQGAVIWRAKVLQPQS